MLSTLLAGNGNIEDEVGPPRPIPFHGAERCVLNGVSGPLRSPFEGLEERRAESFPLHVAPLVCMRDRYETVNVDGPRIAGRLNRSVEVVLRTEVAHDDPVRDSLGRDGAAVAEARVYRRAVQSAVLPQVLERNRVHLARHNPRGPGVNGDREAELPDPGKEVDDRLPGKHDTGHPLPFPRVP